MLSQSHKAPFRPTNTLIKSLHSAAVTPAAMSSSEASTEATRTNKASSSATDAAKPACTTEEGGSGSSKPKKPHHRDPRSQSPSVQISKSLSYFLRHGAEKEKLPIRSDGYIPLDDVLQKQRMKQIKIQDGPNPNKKRSPAVVDVKEIVDNPGDKKRFEMMADESDGGKIYIRAVQGHSIQTVTDLDHVPVTLDNLQILAYQIAKESGASPNDVQASIADLSLAEEAPKEHRLPPGVEILHGTVPDSWNKIKQSGGLHRMKRNHIHLARGRPGVEGVGSGMRQTSPLLIHVDIIKALQDGITFGLASNGAVLTPGIDGLLPLKYVTKVEDKKGHIVWEQDKS